MEEAGEGLVEQSRTCSLCRLPYSWCWIFSKAPSCSYGFWLELRGDTHRTWVPTVCTERNDCKLHFTISACLGSLLENWMFWVWNIGPFITAGSRGLNPDLASPRTLRKDLLMDGLQHPITFNVLFWNSFVSDVQNAVLWFYFYWSLGIRRWRSLVPRGLERQLLKHFSQALLHVRPRQTHSVETHPHVIQVSLGPSHPTGSRPWCELSEV